MGGVLVLLGALSSEARHIQENGSPYWQEMRQNLSAADFAGSRSHREAGIPYRRRALIIAVYVVY